MRRTDASRRGQRWPQWTVALLAATVAAGLPGGVAAATPNGDVGPDGQPCSQPATDAYRAVPWAQQRLDAPRVWNLTRGEGVTVAVIDSGVDGRVPQLRGHVQRGVDIVNGGGPANTDCFGHGTFVAGIIAAQPKTGTGVAGIAPGATILPIRQANNATDGSSAGMAVAIRAAVDRGARVVNISASSFFPSDDLAAAVRYAAGKDVLIVAAASNDAQGGNPKTYPAAYPQVLAVGAVGMDGKRTDFSETGSFLDLVAPGDDIISLSRGGPGHVQDRGTSYSAPFVAGVAALVRAYHPKLTAAQVVHRLELTADHPGTTLPDAGLGWGVVDPYAAVTALLPAEQGDAPPVAAPGRIVPPAPSPVDAGPQRHAARFTAGALGVAGLALLLGTAIPRGRRRRWRTPSTLAGTAWPETATGAATAATAGRQTAGSTA
ncbi:MAG TPA: type VII secretion-associated serine protease mycosin [Mycobacteriales bacterium]|nr:type VII secretion-associated serine protease mycosin [Mycobacteriales bacterium]